MKPHTQSLVEGPFKGLMPYAEGDAPFFFGREHDRDNIIDNLMVSRLTVLYGVSGVGKSSLLRAGVVHGLRQLAARNRANTGNPELAVAVLDSWRDDPLTVLRQRVGEAIDLALHSQARLPPEDWPLVRQLELWTEQLDGELLLILDQFEEYFLYHPDDPRSTEADTPRSLAAELPAVFERAELRVNVLISIREDALDKLDRRFKASILSLFDNRLALDHLDPTAARAAIEGPLGEWNRRRGSEARPVEIEDSLVDAVLDEVRVGRVRLGEAADDPSPIPSLVGIQDRIETPYLQLVLTRLWDEELAGDSHRLRRSTLEDLGGAASIVHSHLDHALGRLSAEEQATAARLFYHLVTPGGSKIAHTEGDLVGLTQTTAEQVAPLLDHLAGPQARILRPVPPPALRPDERAFEIFHDVLAVAVLDWRQRFESARRRREEVEELEQKRRQMIRSAGWHILFLTLAGLVTAGAIEQWNTRNQVWLAELATAQSDWLRQNAENERQDAEDDRQIAENEAKSAREERALANQAREEIERQRQETELEVRDLKLERANLEKKRRTERAEFNAIRLTIEAQRRIEHRVDEATLLAFAAAETWASPDTRNTLLTVLESHPRLARVLPLDESPSGLTSPAPGWAAVHNSDETSAVWLLDGAPPTPPSQTATPPVATGQDPRLTITGIDGGLRVEDRLGDLDQDLRFAIEGKLRGWLLTPPIEEDPGNPSHFLAFGIGPGCLLWWNLSQRSDEHRRCLGERGGVTALAIDPRSGVLAAGWGNGEILLWRPGNAQAQDVWLRQHRGPVDFLVFAGPGVLASADRGSRSLRVWRLEDPGSPGVEIRPLGFDLATARPISALSVSQDGTTLWAVNPSMLYRWFFDPGPTPPDLAGLATERAHIVVPGGVGSEPKSWVGDLDGQIHPGRTNPFDGSAVVALALDPRREFLAAGFASEGARLWHLVDGQLAGPGVPLVEEADRGSWLAFDPTGEQLAVTTAHRGIQLFTRDDGFRQPSRELEAPPEVDDLADLAVTADGRYLVAARQRGGVAIWDLDSGSLLDPPVDLAATGRSRIALDPGGRLLAVGDPAGTVQLWDLASPGHPYLARLDVEGAVTALTFLPPLAGPSEVSPGAEGPWLASAIRIEPGTRSRGRVVVRDLSGLLDPNAWRHRVCRRAQRELPAGSCPTPSLPACQDLCSDPDLPANPSVAQATGGSPP